MLKGIDKMKKRECFIGIMVFLLIVIVCSVCPTKAFAAEKEDTICSGIFVNAINIGGMTESEAREAIQEYIEALQAKKLTIKVEDNTIETTLGELGYTALKNDFVTKALNFGKTGNLVKRYKELKDVEHEQLVYQLEFDLDVAKVKGLVESQCTAYDVQPENATLSRKDGKFIITDHKVGRAVQIEDTIKKIQSAILEDWDHQDVTLEAVVIDDIPDYKREDMEKCDAVLGTFSTNYYSSSTNRANNIANAAGLIDGTVLLPNEIFSAAEGMSPITVENGYFVGGAYQNGEVIESVGGGVCQVSTTLYNAILLAELEVVERFNHSMIVTYVEPAMDAAIAGTYKDLKIKNNTNAPVYIEATTNNRTITFTIYGQETRNTETRVVDYKSEVVEIISPGPEKVTKDPTKPISYRKVTQSSHTGYKAYLWKIVYENGEQVSKEKVNYSSYAAEPSRVVVGTKKDAGNAKKDNKKNEDEEDNNSTESVVEEEE